MLRAVKAVVSFMEGKAVDGSRHYPINTIFDVLSDRTIVLPAIGIAPTALLQSAAQNRVLQRQSRDFTSFSDWLAVRVIDNGSRACVVSAFD